MEIHETEEYRSALIKVKSWKEKIEKSEKKSLFRVLDEKKVFFANMKKTNPNLYSIFQINDKEISESVAEKLYTAKIVID